MDNVEHLLDVHIGESDVQDLPPRASEDVTVGDLRVLRKFESLDEVADLIRRYIALDIPKDDVQTFQTQLVGAPDAWFVKVGDAGLIYLTTIRRGYNANLHVLFWDQRLAAARREVVLAVLATAFELFDLQRITVVTPRVAKAYVDKLGKMGFKQEGLVRKGWHGTDDAVLLGMLREELPWHVKPVPTNILG